jgi:hypothetical protein
MTAISRSEEKLRREFLDSFQNGDADPRRSRFAKHAPLELLERAIQSSKKSDYALAFMSYFVNRLDFPTFFTGDASDGEARMRDTNFVNIFIALSDWYEHFGSFSPVELSLIGRELYRDIVSSTNDFSVPAIKAKFILRNWNMDLWVDHDGYQRLYGQLVGATGLLDDRISILLHNGCNNIEEITMLIETPRAFSDGIL